MRVRFIILLTGVLSVGRIVIVSFINPHFIKHQDLIMFNAYHKFTNCGQKRKVSHF